MNQRTIDVPFKEEVGLSLRRFSTRPLPINFVLDVAHRDKRSHDASPSTGLHCSGDGAIVNVFCGRYSGTIVRLCEDERELAAVVVGVLWRTLVNGPGMRS